MNTFDKNLKRLRNQRNLMQEDLAQKMNVTRQTVSGWETGRRQPDLNTLIKLAEVLDVDIQELIYGQKHGENPKFQKKYVWFTVVWGGFSILILLFRLLLWPYFKVMCNTHHWGLLLTVGYAFVHPFGSFAFGSLISALIQLRMPVRMEKHLAVWCNVFGILMAVPVILVWFGLGIWSRWVVYPVGNAFLSYIFPFLSGSCIALGTTYEKNC